MVKTSQVSLYDSITIPEHTTRGTQPTITGGTTRGTQTSQHGPFFSRELPDDVKLGIVGGVGHWVSHHKRWLVCVVISG